MVPLPTDRPSPRVELPSALERTWQAMRLLQGRTDEAAERVLQDRLGISVSEYMALAALAYSDDGGHLRQQVLAGAIPLNQSSVSRLVARLERTGLTGRYLCQTDRRGVYTQITEDGRAVAARARGLYLEVLGRVIDEAEADPVLRPVVGVLRAAT